MLTDSQEATAMKAREILGMLPERLVIGLAGIAAAIIFVSAPTVIVWLLHRFS